jgi:hypothetical protein
MREPTLHPKLFSVNCSFQRIESLHRACSSSGGAQEKRKTGWNSGTIKIDGFLSFTLPWMLMYFFAGVFLNLTLCMTKLRVLVLSFPDFTDISTINHLSFFFTYTSSMKLNDSLKDFKNLESKVILFWYLKRKKKKKKLESKVPLLLSL